MLVGGRRRAPWLVSVGITGREAGPPLLFRVLKQRFRGNLWPFLVRSLVIVALLMSGVVVVPAAATAAVSVPDRSPQVVSAAVPQLPAKVVIAPRSVLPLQTGVSPAARPAETFASLISTMMLSQSRHSSGAVNSPGALARGVQRMAVSGMSVMATADDAWSTTLSYTVDTKVHLTATISMGLPSGKYLAIYDQTAGSLVTACGSGTTCTATLVPGLNQSTYIATVAGYSGTYPPSGLVGASATVTPPAWSLGLTSEIVASKVKLTVTSNYDVSGMGKYLAIYDQSAGSLVNACYPQGTTCTATTVPLRSQSTYIATFATYSGTYPPSNVVATSDTVTPPAWAVMLNGAGSGFTAVANYDVSGSSRYLGIYNSSTGSLVNACGTGTQCSATVSNTSQLYVATVGNYSSTFAPNPLLAVSVQTGLQGPTGPYETSGGPNPAELSQCFTCAGDPVNTSNGEFFENVTDVSVAGRGPGLVSSRSFSSQRASFDGPLGFGWSFNYNMSLALNSSGTVDVHQENGSMVTFTPDPNGAYHPAARVLASLAHNPDGSWTYIRRAKDIFAFNSTGQLSQLSDLNGNTTTLTRNGSGQLTTATDGAGRSLGYSYDANAKIATVTAPAGRVTTYGHDAAGRLTSVTAPGGAVTSYTYDASNLLTSVTDPRGSVTVNNYDQAQRVIKQTTAAGDLLLAYGVDGSDAQTTITSPGGRVTKETYRSGQMIKRVAGAGTTQQATWTYTYDQNTFGTTSLTDPLGHVTTATYDGSGNRLTGVDPANHQSSWTYNALNEVTTATDPAGTTTTYTYDTAGDPLSISTPLTGTSQTATTTYAHTDTAHPGDVTAITDPNGQTTTLTHTATGTLASSTDPLGNATSFTYDTLDRRLNNRQSPRQHHQLRLRLRRPPVHRHRSAEPHHHLHL